ncbi:FecR domain-containing protein [Pigmentiphaga litoralis]|uniref:FecR domain-containing protein n=1 Tax=Pigmentiphaga litoralis TaxID=516702 RepID=UPI003B43C6B5
MSEAHAPSDVVDQAIAWLLRIEADPSARQQRAWTAWLASDARHAQAWERLRAIDRQCARLDAAAGRVLHRQGRAGRVGRVVNASTVAAGLLVLVCGGGMAHRWVPVSGWMAAYATATGEARVVVLAGGTRVRMDTRTAFDVQEDAVSRTIVLRAGAIAVETAHGDAKAFSVQTDETRVRPLGTYFTVRSEDGATDVTVLRSAVAVAILDSERVIQAGDHMRVDAFGAVTASGRAPAQSDAWTHGMLVADRMPLGEFVRRVARYRSSAVTVDPSIAALPVSGSYALADTDLALAAMAQALKVRLAKPVPGWTHIGPAERAGPATHGLSGERAGSPTSSGRTEK